MLFANERNEALQPDSARTTTLPHQLPFPSLDLAATRDFYLPLLFLTSEPVQQLVLAFLGPLAFQDPLSFPSRPHFLLTLVKVEVDSVDMNARDPHIASDERAGAGQGSRHFGGQADEGHVDDVPAAPGGDEDLGVGTVAEVGWL